MIQDKQILICCTPDYLGMAADLLAPDWGPFPFFYDGPFPSRARLLITWCQFRDYERAAITHARDAGLATLLLADGILEWRNTWEHPEFSRGEIYQPIIADKMACLGPAQVRILESWGNRGKCELVGMPRLDSYLKLPERVLRREGPFRLLIMTARNPGFSSQQVDRTVRSLRDLAHWCERNPVFCGRPIEPLWRISSELAASLSPPGAISRPDRPLMEELSLSDAVVTAPSTTQIESMLTGIPVGLLDYHNCPHYVPAAWVVSAPEHLDQVISELMDPPPAKMAYQNFILHDNLVCRTPAGERLARLVRAMLQIQSECAREGNPLTFPDQILGQPL